MKYAVTPLLQAANESIGLESTGSHAPELVELVAVLLGILTWAIYRRETRRQSGATRWLLPLLRAAIVTFIILLLLEPVIVKRGQALDRGRILVVLDRSRSQERRDPAMKVTRKVELARALGLLQDDPELKRTEAELRDWAESTDVRLQRAFAKVESYSRFERASRLLFDESRGVFGALAWPHVAEVATAGEVLEPLPLPPVTVAADAKRTVTLDRSPEVEFTDLSVALEEAGRRDPDFVVLLSDGRHNRGESPIGPARDLGARGISVYPIGVGSSDEPLDLGVPRRPGSGYRLRRGRPAGQDRPQARSAVRYDGSTFDRATGRRRRGRGAGRDCLEARSRFDDPWQLPYGRGALRASRAHLTQRSTAACRDRRAHRRRGVDE